MIPRNAKPLSGAYGLTSWFEVTLGGTSVGLAVGKLGETLARGGGLSRSWGRWGASLDITVETGTEEKSRMQHINLLRGPCQAAPHTDPLSRAFPSTMGTEQASLHPFITLSFTK